MNMTQINDFFIDKNRVDGITEEDYERVQPKIEAVAAAARTTTNSIYIIDYHKRNFLYSSENPMLAPVGLKDMGYSLYIDYVPKEEQAMLLEINRAGFEEFSRIDLANKMESAMARPRLLLTFSTQAFRQCEDVARDGKWKWHRGQPRCARVLIG